ncbi:MAG: DUF4215 domain-containing protein [Patescibacteria group bacterium]
MKRSAGALAFSAAGLALALGALVLETRNIRAFLTEQGTPYLAQMAGSSASSAASPEGSGTMKTVPTCGNGRLDAGEQCDTASFNGTNGCSTSCQRLTCGDGIISAHLGEQCEVTVQKAMVYDYVTKEWREETSYTMPSCGLSCTTPVCDEKNSCVGGCRERRLAPCPSSPAARVSSSPRASSSSSGTVHGSAPLTTSSAGSSSRASSSRASAVSSSRSTAKAKSSSSAPLPPPAATTCGNGIVEKGEQCDDGQRNSTTRPDACRLDCLLPFCGDGVKDYRTLPPEECDDENNVNDDTCTNVCTIATCGDGIVQTGKEQCDDGNTVNEDTCSNDCRLPSCGDGIKQDNEGCDDGNQNDDDECTTSCTQPRCGDGIVQKSRGEDCDDGPMNSNVVPDACRLNCVHAFCGDGVKDAEPARLEECDYGPANSDTQANACRRICKVARCGDGVVDAGEGCDDGNTLDNDSCTATCQNPKCGDRIVQRETGEACDDGNMDEDDECTSTCLLPVCGDGMVQTGKGEQCDDANTVTEDDCTNMCMVPSCGDAIVQRTEQCDQGYNVNSDAQPNTCRTNCTLPRCGDGATDAGEECDGDRNCTNTCTVVTFLGLRPASRNVLLGTAELFAVGGAAGYVFRKRLFDVLTGIVRRKAPATLEDIPLSDIEYPGRRN